MIKVENSILGRRWHLNSSDETLVAGMAQKFNLPEVVARILVSRGIDFADVEKYFNSCVRDFLPNPDTFKDMDKAIARVKEAILKGQKICILGDYDVDGATSVALLKRFFNYVKADSFYYIPDRLKEGYGPNPEALQKIAAQHADLIITVDCGITSFETLNQAPCDVVILDHHEAEASVPKVVAAVDPKRLDDESGCEHLCAAGVCFIFLVGLNKALREANFYQKIAEPDLLMLLDLVALGTVCDVVPLIGINRAFVCKGLQVLSMRKNVGIKALADVSGVGEKLAGYHLGFVLGPRINACGRLGFPSLAAELLFTEDAIRAQELAEKLHDLNSKRRDIEGQILGNAEALAENQKGNLFIFVHSPNWHSGVIGIVASKLKEIYNLPVFASVEEGDILHGSIRSVAGINVGEIVIAAKEQGLLVAGGGHYMAAGFSCLRSKENEFREFIQDKILSQTKGKKIESNVKIDAMLDVRGASVELAQKLKVLEPYGAANEEPCFMLTDVVVGKSSLVGENHVQCFLASSSGKSIRAIYFKGANNALGQALLNNKGETFLFVGKLHADSYQGRTNASFIIEDGAFA
jgi:single-stranded-DNA-specific exonuclease